MSDRLMTKLGIAKALRSMATISAGLHEWEAALNWCAKQGFIQFTGRRGEDGTTEFRLTQRGASAVWLFWKAYLTGRQAHAGQRVDETAWGQAKHDAESVTLDDPYLHGTDPQPA